MKAPKLLLACCLIAVLDAADEGQHRRWAASGADPRVRQLGIPRFDCGGEPCDAVVRGLVAFFDRRLTGLDGNGRACADCHMVTDNFQLSPAGAEARFQLLQRQRRRNPNADDPLFRPIDADDFRTNGENASDFSNLRQNGLVRITFTLPSNIKLIDPATNAPSAETFVDVWRSVPTVNDVALTGPDDGGSRGRAARTRPADTSWTPASRRFKSRRSVRSPITRRSRTRRRSGFSTTCPRSSGCCSRTIVFARCPTPSERARHRCRIPIRRSTRSRSRARSVFVRACAQCHGGPGQSTPQAPVIRFHNILSQCPRPVRHR